MNDHDYVALYQPQARQPETRPYPREPHPSVRTLRSSHHSHDVSLYERY